MNTGVAKAALGIKRPLVGTETFRQQRVMQLLYHLLGIKRPLVGTETLNTLFSSSIISLLGIKRPLVGTETCLN